MSQRLRKVSDVALLVRKVRLEKKLSQEKAAGLTGVGRRFLSELESGQKETLELGKVLQVLSRLGIIIEVRGDGER